MSDRRSASRRPSGRRITRFPASGKAHSLCRSSSSHRTRSAGLRREPCVREEFSPLPSRVFQLNLQLRCPFPTAAQIRRVLRRGCFLVLAGKGAHNASQRQTRGNRVDRNDFSDTGEIDTFGTLQLDEPLSIATVNTSCNTDFA